MTKKLRVYELNAFDYVTKGRRVVAVAATSRPEAVAMFNGRELGGRAFTGRVDILKDPGHPALAAGEGVILVRRDESWIPLPELAFTFEGSEEAVAEIEATVAPLGFVSIPASISARDPERRWWRAADNIVVVLSQYRGRVSVSASGGGLTVPVGWAPGADVVGRIQVVERDMAATAALVASLDDD